MAMRGRNPNEPDERTLDRISDRIEVVWEGDRAVSLARGCHLCSQVKQGPTPDRVLYELAFHYDRRHKGWTVADVVRPLGQKVDG